MNALQDIMWTQIIDPLWHKRNNIKHKNTEVHNEREAETLNNIIKWFVDHQYEVLSSGDIFLAGTDVSKLLTMKTVTKNQWLRYMELA